jgi:hypothetical protein
LHTEILISGINIYISNKLPQPPYRRIPLIPLNLHSLDRSQEPGGALASERRRATSLDALMLLQTAAGGVTP